MLIIDSQLLEQTHNSTPTNFDAFRQALSAFIIKVFDSPLRRSETVADAIRALLRLADCFASKLTNETRDDVFGLLVQALSDHTITNKGDVGLFVRLAAIEALQPEMNMSSFLAILDAGQLRRVIQLVAGEAVFHRNKTFPAAIKKLTRLAMFVLNGEFKFVLLLDELSVYLFKN